MCSRGRPVSSITKPVIHPVYAIAEVAQNLNVEMVTRVLRKLMIMEQKPGVVRIFVTLQKVNESFHPTQNRTSTGVRITLC